MARKATTTKKTEPKAESPKKDTVIVKFERTQNAAVEYKIRTVRYRINEFKQRIKVDMAPSQPDEIVMRDGDTLELPREEFEILVKAKVLRSKEDMEKRQELIDNRTPMEKMLAAERNLVLNDLPYEV